MSKYKKGDKFVIEIAERHTHYTDDNKPYNLYRIKGFNSLVFDDNGLDRLTKPLSHNKKDDDLYSSIVCAITHTMETCDNCKKCGNSGIDARINLVKRLSYNFIEELYNE